MTTEPSRDVERPTIVVEDVDGGGGCASAIADESMTEDQRWIPVDPYYEHRHLRRGSDIGAIVPCEQRHEARVLVIYTGGTIGMKREANGVYRPAPHLLEDAVRDFPRLNDKEYSRRYFGNYHYSQPLVLPDCGEAKRIIYTVYEYDPLLDSSNMTMDDWIRIATDIHDHYRQMDGFVILHGTDTMAYTASALSFMLENLEKPVIITGSQIPIFEARTDAQGNFLGALILAGNYTIPEVALYFNNKLLRGNRSVKTDAGDFNAFNSPSLDPLVTFGTHVVVHERPLLLGPRGKSSGEFTINTKLNRNVGLLRLFPSITLEMVQTFLRPPLRGVVLQTYGNGNAPSNRTDILRELKKATDRGLIVVNITQCYRGYVQNAYETGQVLVDAGVLPGFDMTPEAALTKLSYVLGQECSHGDKIKLMTSNLRGEMTMERSDGVNSDWLATVNRTAASPSADLSEELYHVACSILTATFGSMVKDGTVPNVDLLRKQGAPSRVDQGGAVGAPGKITRGTDDLLEFLVKRKSRDEKGPPASDSLDECNSSAYERKLVGSKLCSLAEKGDVQTLCLYKLAGIDLDQPDAFGRTALQVAIANSQVECAHFLLDQRCGARMEATVGKSVKRQLASDWSIFL